MTRWTCAVVAALALAPCSSAQAPEPQLDYWLYVAAESADEIYKIRFDGTAAVVDKVIQVGTLPTEVEGPHGLAVDLDGKHWYVSMAHGVPFGKLYKYTTAADELVGQTELGLFPATMQISSATGLLYCVNFDLHGDMRPSSVSIVDVDAMVEVARPVTGPMPHGSRISRDGRHHYSCAMMSGQLFEIDALDFSVNRVLKLDKSDWDPYAEGHAHDPKPPEDAQAVANDPELSKPTWVHPHPTKPVVYVALNAKAQIVEVDLEEWQIVRRLETAKGPYNLEVAPDGKKLIVSYKTAGAVGIWDLENGKELARIPSSRKVTHGVAISSDGRYGFVSSEGIGSESGTVDVFDLRKNTKVCTVEVGLQAGGLTFWKAEPRQ